MDRKGYVYAAGAFYNSTGNYYVAKWNDTTWSQVGTGANALNPNGAMYALATDNLNNVYVAGGFSNAAGKQFVAKWNGTNWTELGTGANALNANGIIYSLVTDASGNVYAAGSFTNVSGKQYVAKWNGTNWTELGTGANALNANGFINSVKIDNTGNVCAAGSFRNGSNEYYVAKYNGTSWSEIGSGANSIRANGNINSIVVTNTGNIYAAGFGTNINGGTNVVKWNGTSWSEVFNVGGASNSAIRSITIDSTGNLYAGGDFKNVNNHSYVAKWNGNNMHELGKQGEYLPSNNGINLVTTDIHGNTYAVGNFWSTPGTTDVAKWDGVGWKQLKNNTLPVYVENIEAITTDNSGNLYVGGRFKNLSGEYYVGKWDGNNWIELTNSAAPLHAIDRITCLATDSAGNIYATGLFENNSIIYGIAKWDGHGWTRYASIPVNDITYLLPGASGTVYVIGYFTNGNSNYYVAKVEPNGSWSELGTGANALNANNLIKSIVIDRSGNIYAGGMFFNSSGDNYIAKWNGTSWSQLGSIPDISFIYSLTTDSTNNVYACVSRSSISKDYVAKWNGTNWSELNGDNHYNFSSEILSIHKDRKESIYVSGLFGNSGKNCVMALGNSVLLLQKPVLASSPIQFCNTAGTQTIKILNSKDTSRVHATAKLDASPLTFTTDSTFTFDPSLLSPGNHRITVFLSIGTDSMYTVKDFTVLAASTPDVNISASTTTVTNLNPVIVTATNASGGGTSPLFTFAKNRTFTTILQVESSNNVMNLDPVTLSVGANWIYVRMKTSNTCYISETNIDSINITLSLATGISDIDFPNQQINVYPNPFNEALMIKGLQSSKTYTVSLVNQFGQTLILRTIRSSTDVKIKQNFTKGSYWLKIYDNSKKRLLGTIGLIKH
ncbi:MAG: T9SS type A sorting domain-containing protein [Chitinophagaceae bacterium]